MTKFRLVGAALVFSAIQLTPVSAQVSEPATAAARDPGFSIYSSYSSGGARFGASRAMAQTLPEDALGPRRSVRPHRAHHMMKHY
ncbi:MAG TPA: hypothetical protein VGM09_04190 [Bradyrhizobium sp.]